MSYSLFGNNQKSIFFMFILILVLCAVTSAYRRFFIYIYLDRERSSGLFLISYVARDGSSDR